MIHCYIALGSNLDKPLLQVQSAMQSLAKLPSSSLTAISPWYRSAAIGPGQQADYVNGVAELLTTLEPLPLLAALQSIEQQHHRQRLQHWGPRTLDLDLLLYGNERIELPTLSVPHPRMLERNFVLYPLFDIAPELRLPTGTTLKNQLKQCPMSDLRLVDSSTYSTMSGHK
jgi:2-amino-4-hydroxy-6-hydroxymethyldihydropteridine diphosphokinase